MLICERVKAAHTSGLQPAMTPMPEQVSALAYERQGFACLSSIMRLMLVGFRSHQFAESPVPSYVNLGGDFLIADPAG